jgi:hypothetical protein
VSLQSCDILLWSRHFAIRSSLAAAARNTFLLQLQTNFESFLNSSCISCDCGLTCYFIINVWKCCPVYISRSERSGWFQGPFRAWKCVRAIFLHAARSRKPWMCKQPLFACWLIGADRCDVCELEQLFDYIAYSTSNGIQMSSYILCRRNQCSLKMTVLWGVALCSLVDIYRLFRGAYCLNHQDNRLLPQPDISTYSGGEVVW